VGCRNMMVMSEAEIWLFCPCAMRNMQYNRYYSNISVIVDLAVWQIPHSTEHISSYASFCHTVIFDVEACVYYISVSTQ